MLSKISRLILKLSSLVLFIAVCYVALFYAYGYKYDEKQRDVRKTSIIDLIGNIREARVLLNGKLEANFLPYQIKGVDPGSYNLSISKAGYQAWQREIKVEEDIVTIINDILLVPSALEQYTKLIKDYSVAGKLVTSQDMIFFYDPVAGGINLLSMYYDGTFKDEILQLQVPKIDKIEPLENDRFLVYTVDELSGDEGPLYYFGFPERRFFTFNRPAGAFGFKLNRSVDLLYFFINDGLFAVPMSDIGKLAEADLQDYLVGSNISAVSFGFNRDVYLVSAGVPYKTDENFGSWKPLAFSLDAFKYISARTGRNYGAIIARNQADSRALYITDKRGRMSKLADNIKGEVYLNGYDQVLYIDAQNRIWYYDPDLKVNELVAAYDRDIEVLGWFSDEGHFIYKDQGQVLMGDVFNSNRYIIIAESKDLEKIFVFSKNLFFLKEGRLFSINWRNAA